MIKNIQTVVHHVCTVSVAHAVKVLCSFTQPLYGNVCLFLALLSKVGTGREKCYKVVCFQFEVVTHPHYYDDP